MNEAIAPERSLCGLELVWQIELPEHLPPFPLLCLPLAWPVWNLWTNFTAANLTCWTMLNIENFVPLRHPVLWAPPPRLLRVLHFPGLVSVLAAQHLSALRSTRLAYPRLRGPSSGSCPIQLSSTRGLAISWPSLQRMAGSLF